MSIFLSWICATYYTSSGVDSLALALDELMSDAELRKKMGKAAKEEMKQYAPDKIWNMWEELMNKFVS